MLPKTFHASDHDIDHLLIDPDAITVLQRLKQAGFNAYLVGGSVRDLLVKKSPKDFDISTSALPEQIKRIFGRQCLLIGRRFRLAHIRFGHKVIEVSTFRAGGNEGELILQDNVWGTPEEDVLRRDFTINGLFYDPFEHQVIDYIGGWEDIHKGILRAIGNPEIRFKQDPVRMIRLLKFRARFGFEVEEETEKALKVCREEIDKSSPARILEELFRMLESGASAPFFKLLHEYGILHHLFPTLDAFIRKKGGKKIFLHLSSADKLTTHKGKNVLDRGVLASSLVFPILEAAVHEKGKELGRSPHMGDIMLLAAGIVRNVVSENFSHFPRRISSIMSFVTATQYRLTPLSGKKHFRPKMIKTKEFALALNFLKLRALSDEKLIDVYKKWKNIYQQNKGQRLREGHHANSS